MRLTFTVCMRRALLLIVPLFLCTILLANDSQDGEKITLFEKDVPLKTVFKKITSQTGIKFVYSNRLVDDEQKVDVSVRNASLDEVMQQIFYGRKYELQRTSPKSVVLIVHEKVVSAVVSPVANDVVVIDVTGTVSDESGEKLPGATVLVRGTNKATMTDGEGRFRLVGVLSNAKLLVSYTGYEAEEVKLMGKRELIVRLQRGENQLSEVVVAYGTSTQRSNTGAVTVVKGEQIQNLPNRSFDKSLQGLVPGLQITNGTGQPGGGISSMVQRGISTGADALSGSTVRNPLIVIDGIPVTQDNMNVGISSFGTSVTNPIAQINTSDIESISVLKDAAAIALYGSKASNGVILVTTKKGKAGPAVFSIRSQMDFSILPKRNLKEILSQEQYLQMLYDTYRNTNSSLWTDEAIRKDLYNKFPYRVLGSDTSFYPQPDWGGEIYRDFAPTFINELSMSGGNDKTNYYINVEYSKQNGIVKNTGYDRKSFRINFESKPLSWLTLGTNTFMSYNVQDFTNANEGENTYGLASTLSPLNPIRRKDGSYIMIYPWGGNNSQTLNPVAKLEYDYFKNVSYRGMSKVYGESSFLKYFKLTSSLGVDFMLTELSEKTDPRFRQRTSNVGSISERDTRRASLITNNILYINIPIQSNHDFKLLFGQEAQILTSRNLSGTVRGDTTALPVYDQLSSPGYTMSFLGGTRSRQTMLSWFGQINYGYGNKYFVSTSIRRDGSSRFGSRELWGTYWSTGLGWDVTRESFLEKNDYLSYLKLRGSLGVAGNSGAVNPTAKYEILRQAYYSGIPVIMPSASPGNLDIKWERTYSWNIGLDAKILKNRIGLTIDLYNKSTKDLIYSINLPSISGYTSVNDNIGDISNKGIEVSISGNIINRENLRWNASANLSMNRNILVKSNYPLIQIPGGLIANEEGRSFNSLYIPQWAGVNSADGKPMWIDSSGKATSTYSKAKRMFVGNPQPDGYGAFNNTISYKGFDLSFQLYYQFGSKIFNDKMRLLLNDGAVPYINQVSSALNYWRKPGDVSENPRRALNSTDGGMNNSTRFLYDGDYIKLSNVMLSYSFQKALMSRLKLKSLRVFVQGNNLAIWSKIPGNDPDNVNIAGAIGSPYPIAKSFSVGLQASL